MATFSQQFLSGFESPGMLAGAAQLGQALGSAPGLIVEAQKKREEANLLKNLTPGSLEYNKALVKIYEDRGELEKAASVANTVEEQTQKKQASASLVSQVQTILTKLQNKTDPKSLSQIQRAKDLLQQIGSSGVNGASLYVSAVNELKKDVEGEVLGVQDRADLAKIFKPASVATFLKSNRVEDLKLLKQNEATPAQPKFQTIYNEESQQNEEWAFWSDPDGNMQREYLGVAEETKEKPNKSTLDMSWGATKLERVRDKRDAAQKNVVKYNSLVEIASDREWWDRGSVGKTLSEVEQSLGLGTEASTHRANLSEIRMSKALNLLPQGPASDRDVALALDASIDPNNLKNEEAARYLRGMAKIAKAEAEYQDSLITYMTISKDANALGFESWVNKTRTQREIEQHKNAAPEAVKQVVNIILNIETLRETNPEQAEANFLALMNSPELSGVAKSLQDFSLAEKNWQRVTEENPDLLRMY